jgi:hypothetical protein
LLLKILPKPNWRAAGNWPPRKPKADTKGITAVSNSVLHMSMSLDGFIARMTHRPIPAGTISCDFTIGTDTTRPTPPSAEPSGGAFCRRNQCHWGGAAGRSGPERAAALREVCDFGGIFKTSFIQQRVAIGRLLE